MACLVTLAPLCADAEVIMDGSLGTAAALSGPDYAINAQLGQQAGGNLFHSFSAFNLMQGESATFSGPPSIQNIVSRVTGGQASSIDGTLRSSIVGAHLFLLNPAGILFGPNASLDLSGAFFALTADYLEMQNGARFHTDPLAETVLSVAPPAAFGFLDDDIAPIQLLGSHLAVPEGYLLGLGGGPITIQGGSLLAPTGSIQLESQATAATTDGTVDISGGHIMNVSGSGEGRVVIRSGSFTLADSSIHADALAGTSAGGIDIKTGGPITMRRASLTANAFGDGVGGQIRLQAAELFVDAGIVEAATVGTGPAGQVRIVTDRLTLANNAYVTVQTESSGNGGSLMIDTPELILDAGSLYAHTNGPGKAGHIQLNLGDLSIASAGLITAATTATGSAGDIDIIASGKLSITGEGAGINSNAATGRGGRISIAGDSLTLADGGTIQVDANGSGAGGRLDIQTRQLVLDGKGFIGANAYGSGAGGQISIHAGESVQINDGGAIESGSAGSARGGSIHIDSPDLTLQGGQILAYTTGDQQASAGQIDLNLDNLTIRNSLGNSGLISAASIGYGQGGTIAILARGKVLITGDRAGINSNTDAGTGGDISIASDMLELTEGGTLQVETNASGAGGRLHIQTRQLIVDEGAYLAANTYGTGSSGQIAIQAGESVLLERGGSIQSNSLKAGAGGSISLHAGNSVSVDNTSEITTDAYGSGAGGNIDIETPSLSLDHGRISAATLGETASGPAGTIRLAVDNLFITNEGLISSASTGAGVGGKIDIRSADTLAISGNLAGINSNATGSGGGGEVSIRADTLQLLNFGTIEAVTAGSGKGGAIRVDVRRLHADDGGILTWTNGNGPGGSIAIHASESIQLKNFSIISSDTFLSGGGGNIEIETPSLAVDFGLISASTRGVAESAAAGQLHLSVDALTLTGGGSLASTSLGAGAGGEINVAAQGTISISGKETGMQSNARATGQGGTIAITADTVRLTENGTIQVATNAQGAAGRLTIDARLLELDTGGSLHAGTFVSGSGGQIAIHASEAVQVENAGYIQSSTVGSGMGGSINIDTSSLKLDAGVIAANAYAQGSGGHIAIHADASVIMQNMGGVESGTQNIGAGGLIDIDTPQLNLAGGYITAATFGGGHAGNIRLQVGDLMVTQAGFIFSGSSGAGDGGKIDIAAKEDIRVSDMNSGISNKSFADGKAGSIDITSRRLTVENDGIVSAGSSGNGAGGSIRVHAREAIELRSGVGIATSTTQSDGGDIELRAGRMLALWGGEVSTRVAGGAGNGGNIAIAPIFIILDDAARIVANAYGGNGGNIRISAEHYLAAPRSVVSASSQLGIDGIILIDSLVADLSSTLNVLPSHYLDSTGLLDDPCAAHASDAASSLVVGGRGGLPRQPGDWLPSPW